MKLYKNQLKVSYAKITILIFVFMLQGFNTLNPLLAQSRENLTAESILDSVVFQNNSLSPFSESYIKTMTWERAAGSGTSIEEGISHWDGIKSDYIANSYDLEDNEKVQTHSIRAIWDGKQAIAKQVSFSPSQQQGIDYVGISKKSKNIIFQKRSFSTYLSSYGKTEEGFVDLLKKSSDLVVKEQKEKINGHDCYVLEGTIEQGDAIVWIDPNTGFNIRKIIVSNIKDGEITGITDISEAVIDDIQIQKVEDVWLPMSVSSTFVTRDSEGNIINEAKTTYKRTQFEFNPDFEKLNAFEMDGIPNGTRIKDLDNGGLLYEWQNGKIIPYIDESFIDELDKSTFEVIENGDIPEKLGTVEEDKNNLDESIDIENIQTNNLNPNQEVLSESSTYNIYVIILIVLSIIVVIGWQIIRRFRA